MENLHMPLLSGLLGGALLVLQIALMLSVGMYRVGARKGVGVDGDAKLERLVRRHGNLSENAAIFVTVFALYELIFGQTILAMMMGAAFFVARLAHITGFSNMAGSHLVEAQGGGRFYVLMRSVGAGLTALSGLGLGIALVVSILLHI